MAVTLTLYRTSLKTVFNKELDWDTDVQKTALHTSTGAPAQDTDQYWANTNEITGTNYTGGGVSIAATTYDTGTTKVFKLGAANAVWTTLTTSTNPRYARIYDTVSLFGLVGWVDFGGDQVVTAATFTIAWAGGIVSTYTVA